MATATQSFVTSASAAANTVAMPAGTRQGDLIIVVAHRSAVTAPSLATGYSSLATGSGNTNSYRIGYIAANGLTDATGTWTNATNVWVIIYRGAGGVGVSAAATKAAATTANIPTVTLQKADGTSWVMVFAASNQVATQGTPLAGATTARGTPQASATDNMGIWDTGAGVSSFAATTSANNTSVVSSGGTVEILTAQNPPYVLQDNFDATTLNATNWRTEADAGAAVSQTGGVIQIATTAAAAYGRLVSQQKYDMYGAYVTTKLVNAGNQASGVVDAHPCFITDTAELNHLFWQVENNTLFAIYGLAGSDTTVLGTLAYDATKHVYFRIRESSGRIYWDYSATGLGEGSWTNYTSITTATFKYGLMGMLVGVQAGVFTTPQTTAVQFDDFNIVPTPPQGYLKISNRNTGPMALRHLFRQPYIPSGNIVQAIPTGYSAGLFGGAYFGQAYFGDAWGGLPTGTVHTSALTAGLSFTGVIQNRTARTLTAGLSFTGAFKKSTARTLTAGLSFTGNFVKRTFRALTGGLSFTGVFNASHLFVVALTAGLSFTGNFIKRTSKNLSGALSFTGSISKFVARGMTAALSFTGAFTKRTTRSFTAGLSYTSTFIKKTAKAFTGGVSFIGAIAAVLSHGGGTLYTLALTASLSFTGAITKRTARTMTAGLSFVSSFLGYIAFAYVTISTVVKSGVRSTTSTSGNTIAEVSSGDILESVTTGKQTDEVVGGQTNTTITTSKKDFIL